MAYAAVTFLSDNLTDLLTDQPDLIHAAEREEIVQLQNQLSELKHVLGQCACAKEGRMLYKEMNEAYRQVNIKVIEAVYQVEDDIDTVISKRWRSRSKRGLIPRLVSTSTPLEIKEFTRDKLKPLIHKLQTEFPTVASDHESCRADTNLPQPRRHTPLKATMKEYVGQEDDIETLVNLIMKESDKLEVVSVAGVVGLGKRTIARRIFRDPRITNEFPILIWVTASCWEFDMKRICLAILESYTSRDMSSKTTDELLLIVPEYLRMAKFFMVVDGAWSENTELWDKFRRLLPTEDGKSKVLITARGKTAASLAVDHIIELHLLSDEESWNLLQLEVFGHLNDCPQGFEEPGKVLAKHCRGLPLSVLITAGTLKKLPLNKQWEEVHQSLNTHIDKYYGNRVLETLVWSYDRLPDYLKDCFDYLGMLPAQTEIPVWKLTQLWIAEGLIRQQQGQTLEETAKDYLIELIHANFVMVDKISLHGEPKTYQVHSLIHDLCLYKAGLQNLCQHVVMTAETVSKRRTFLCVSNSPVILQNENVFKFTKDLIRVLEAHRIKFPTFPTKLTQFAHLRYITLSCDELKILPADISNLWNLQTLVVDTKSPTLEVKADIWKLMHLRFLKTKASMTLTKSNGSGCKNLHTLTRLSPQSFTRDVPDKAKKLKVLGIRGMLSDSLSFEKLHSLEKLKLQHDVFPRKQSEYPLAALPQPDMFPPNLKFLVLSGTYLDWKHTSILGILPTLVALKLKDNAFKGAIWEVADGGFKRLEALSINEAELKYWTSSSSSFPELKNLELNNCEKLLEVPLELGKTLEKLSMSCVTRYAVSCAEKIKQARAEDGAEFKLEIHHGDM